MQSIPFSKPYIPPCSRDAIDLALKSNIQQGDGLQSKVVEDRIRMMYPNFQVFLMPSCTSALELSLMLLDVGPGDEVIVPSFTFTSMPSAITKFWATPVFCDIRFENGCLDVDMVEDLITEKTKAITWVNYGGQEPDLKKLKFLAEKYGVALIEDAAHNFGVLTNSQKELTGDFVAFSFHATKNIQCGEGGAIAIRNSENASRAHIMREKGTNRREFSLGKVSKYSWVDRGSSYLLSEVSASILNCQLDHFEQIQNRRLEVTKIYNDWLQPILDFDWKILISNQSAGHLFGIISPTHDKRALLMRKLADVGITSVSHYEDLSSSPGARKFTPNPDVCPLSKDFSAKILRLPLFYEISDNEIERVIASLLKIVRTAS